MGRYDERMDRRLKVLLIGIALAALALGGVWWSRRPGPAAEDGPRSLVAEVRSPAAQSPRSLESVMFSGDYDGTTPRPVFVGPSTYWAADLAAGYGKAVSEEGLDSEKAVAWRDALLAELNPCFERCDPFEAMLHEERDRLVMMFLLGYGLSPSGSQCDQLMKLASEEYWFRDRVRREPPDVPWIERARLFTAQALEWERRLEAILNAEQLAALRQKKGGIFDFRNVVLARTDPAPGCERVNFSRDPEGERLARKWAADIFGPTREDARLQVYAAEYARRMLELGMPDYEAEGRASLAYRLRQIEIQASVQKTMLEDPRFTPEEVARIRGWDDLYEGAQ